LAFQHHSAVDRKNQADSMSYLAFKHLHLTFVLLSGCGFALRGYWMLTESVWRQRRITAVLPHLIDSGLLASGLTLAIWSSQYPFLQDWLTAKFFALIAYIIVGTFALKRGKTRIARTRFFLCALLIYGYLLSVGLTRNSLPFSH
jgi:uncharacterized membrane protein SirB2